MKLNRRKVLASVGILGGSAALGGVGTRALFSDEEKVTATISAGGLDIQLNWKAVYNGKQIALQEEPTNDDEVCIAARLENIKPGDTGCFSLSIHNDTNPAWVWFAMDIVDETDGESGGDGSVLADNIISDLFWDDDEDYEIDKDESVMYKNETLRTLANNIKKSTGGVMPEWYSQGTQYISLPWDIPVEVGNEIEGDKLTLRFSVYAEQRRNNEDPKNPWK